MGKDPLNHGGLIENSTGIGPVSREAVHALARALALIAGRTPHHVSQADYERARCELTGETDWERQDSVLDVLPEEASWAPVPGSTGHQIPLRTSARMF